MSNYVNDKIGDFLVSSWFYLDKLGINHYLALIFLELIIFIIYFLIFGAIFGFKKFFSPKKIWFKKNRGAIFFLIFGNIVLFLAVWAFFDSNMFTFPESDSNLPFVHMQK